MATADRWLKPLLGVLVLVTLLSTLLGGLMLLGGVLTGPSIGSGMIRGGTGATGANPAGYWLLVVGMGLHMLSGVAFLAALIVGAILLIRWAFGWSAGAAGVATQDAQAILRRRYAAGEIDQATFERMQRQLEREWDITPRPAVTADDARKPGRTSR